MEVLWADWREGVGCCRFCFTLGGVNVSNALPSPQSVFDVVGCEGVCFGIVAHYDVLYFVIVVHYDVHDCLVSDVMRQFKSTVKVGFYRKLGFEILKKGKNEQYLCITI